MLMFLHNSLSLLFFSPSQGVVLEATAELVDLSFQDVNLFSETIAFSRALSEVGLEGAHRITCHASLCPSAYHSN